MKALEITQYRVVSAYDRQRDGRPDPLSSVLKVKGTELLQATAILGDWLPPLRASSDVAGYLQSGIAEAMNLPAGLPVICGAGGMAVWNVKLPTITTGFVGLVPPGR